MLFHRMLERFPWRQTVHEYHFPPPPPSPGLRKKSSILSAYSHQGSKEREACGIQRVMTFRRAQAAYSCSTTVWSGAPGWTRSGVHDLYGCNNSREGLGLKPSVEDQSDQMLTDLRSGPYRDRFIYLFFWGEEWEKYPARTVECACDVATGPSGTRASSKSRRPLPVSCSARFPSLPILSIWIRSMCLYGW